MVDVMKVLATIDRSGLTVRDIRILECISSYPGQSGSDISEILELQSCSGVRNSLAKLLKYDMIDDQRERKQQAIPGRLYILPKGDEFLKKVLL